MSRFGPDALSCLPESALQHLLKSAHPFEFEKNHLLLHASDTWNTAYLLESGIVRMFYTDRDGNEHNKRFFTNGGFFWPVTASLREHATGFSMESLTPIRGLCWSYETLRHAFENSIEWLSFNNIWTERLLTHKLQRERELLQLSATERYSALCRNEPQLINSVPAHHLASYIGITPVSLSRLKKTLIL